MNTLVLTGLKALVVDDCLDNAALIQFILDAEGMDTTIATSLSDALRLYRSVQPDILIAELDIPLEGGYELIRQIRQLGITERKLIPAIALLGYRRPEVRLKAIQAGYQDCLQKPIDQAALLASVRQLLSLSSQAETGTIACR